jgi:hypothetical protein
VIDTRPVAFGFKDACRFIGVGKRMMRELVQRGVFTIQRESFAARARHFFFTDELELYRGVHKRSADGDIHADADKRIARVIAFRKKEGRLDDESRRRLKQHGLI